MFPPLNQIINNYNDNTNDVVAFLIRFNNCLDYSVDVREYVLTKGKGAKNHEKHQLIRHHHKCKGSKSDGKGFGYDDILADADAYLIANKGISDLSATVSNLYQHSKNERIKMFYKERFASSKDNVISAFTKLADGIDFGPINNFNTGLLLRAANAASLPTKEAAKVLASVFADFIENPSH